MRHLVFYLFFICPCVSLAQRLASSCQASDSLRRLYKNDADRLAIRRVNHVGSTYKDSVRINRQISAAYLSALLAVHNARGLAATDTVTRLLNIHTYNPGLNSIVVTADSNLVWMTNLRHDILPTRDYEIDKMMRMYYLERGFYSSLLQPSMVVFRTDTNSNLAPLAKKIKRLLGVRTAEAEFMYGDGNDIRDSINSNYTELVYSYGWQECLTGCEQRRFWKFHVFPDCSVEYMGSYGDALVPTLALSEQENERLFSEVKIYANPVNSKLYLECSKPATLSLSILNKKNEVVYTSVISGRDQEINLVRLPNGTYRLLLEGKSLKKTIVIKKGST